MTEPNKSKKPTSSETDLFVSAISDTSISSSSAHVDAGSSHDKNKAETDDFVSPISDTTISASSSKNANKEVSSKSPNDQQEQSENSKQSYHSTKEQAIQTQEISLDSIILTSVNDDHDEKHQETQSSPKIPMTIHSSDSSQIPSLLLESNLSTDLSEEFHQSTIYQPQDVVNSSTIEKEVELSSPDITLSSQYVLTRFKRVNLPLRYSVEYGDMEQRFSPRTLAEIYDDELFSYYDKHEESISIRINHKEGILCCIITGLAIALLVLAAFMITLLVEPIVEIIKALSITAKSDNSKKVI
ncbi:uncharacterized protein isoform X2 [Musca autumnalis]|uniref:uncharacterized protein isoform X2 n=1 Tax=Musca autumnalis TaxID=221902 RepID=UPI003CF50824